MGTECYDRSPPAPYSFRGGLLWSFRELAKFSLPIRPKKPTPNNMPEATTPKTSEPCNAATRGLSRLFESTIAPTSITTTPVNRLLFSRNSFNRSRYSCTLLRPGSRPRIVVTGKPGIVSPSPLV